MKAADMIVCSSRYEGLSTVVTEALILGRPVVTTPCNGMAELLGDSEFGLIAESDDNGLHRALRRMLTEPGLGQHYAAMAARRGRDFRREALARKTEDFFTELLEGTSKQ
jgi:glycosyltransferase involved in cell wall biosynthesis